MRMGVKWESLRVVLAWLHCFFGAKNREFVSRRKAKEQRALGADICTETM